MIEKFTVTKRSFIDNRIVEEGAVIEIETDVTQGGMKPGSNLTPFQASPVRAVKGKGKAEDDIV